MKRSSARSLLSLGLAAALLSAGCVGRGTHRQVVAERDRLQRELDRTQATNESLDAERVKLLDQMEDLRQRRETLERDVAKLRRAEAELSSSLAESKAQLAARNAEIQKLRGTYDSLVQDLEAEVAAGQIEIEQLREGLRLNVTQEILFASGSAELNPTGQGVLRRVAAQVRELPHTIEVQGHTDDVPVRPGARFASNWELAAARATRVVRLLTDAGVAPERLRAASFGQYHPVASNETPEGRLKNRRIEIRLEPIPPEETAEAPAQPAP